MTTTPGWSRRRLLQSALAVGGLGAAGALSGCGSPLAAGLAGTPLNPGTVTFWNLFGGGDGARLQTMLDVYMQEHGGSSSLQAATFAWGNPYYTKVSLATLGDKPPDVAVAHLTRSQNLANADLLTPITDEMLALVDLSPSDFTPKVWDGQKIDGTSYAIPIDTHPFVLFYNKDVCEQAGLLDGSGTLAPIQGVEQWEAALTAAQEVTGAFAVSSANVSENATPWRLFQTLYQQHAGATPFLGDGGTQLTVDEDAALDTLAYIRRMSEQGWLPRAIDYAGSQTQMFTGEAAFYLQGEWEITTAQGVEGLDFGMVPIPQLYDQPAAQGDSHTFVLPRMDRTPEQMQLAMGFVRSMLDQSLTWAKGGHIPAYIPTLESQEYLELTPQADYAQAAEYVVYDAPAWYSGSGSTFENTVGAQVGLVQQQRLTPEQAMAAIRQQLAVYLDTQSPV
ncbi:extracellular solute-binding protein [uncultured Pseudokineococcus sp.]|uniref:extracellular solute-binding protein n=1 Tax=uncultured Pseudokineococcus sp. TaxID=1642928 RepID=UPI0026092D2E|nr:extracellular solute-binding protein [uncultured Pseudokineococcus sp.]